MALHAQLRTLLSRYSVTPRKVLGQSFCVDQALLKRMCDFAEVGPGDVVVEVGAGFGFLTELLADAARSVVAYERDPRLVAALADSLGGRDNVRIVDGDFLRCTLPPFSKLVANPPYSISTELLLKLLEADFDCAVLTLQREFVEKVQAIPGRRGYGMLSVATSYRADVEVLERVPRDAFWPKPGVESVVVRITPHPPCFPVTDERLFLALLKALFTQRNRKLKNALERFLRSRMSLDKHGARLLVEGIPHADSKVHTLSPAELGYVANWVGKIVQGKLLEYGGLVFYVPFEVYEPADDTYLLAERLPAEMRGTRVLDVGTGCGILAVISAQRGADVVAVEISPQAMSTARLNARLNGVANKVNLVRGDLLSSFRGSAFELITFNPPYLPVARNPRTWLERSWSGGPTGRAVTARFLRGLARVLGRNGRVLLVLSSLSAPDATLAALRDDGFRTRVVNTKKVAFERLDVIEASRETINPQRRYHP
jgi:16S rRNA (adenine1518-N6/adenine1519-N6)-dimethyltransferase